MITEEEYFKLSRYDMRYHSDDLMALGLKGCPRCKKFLPLESFNMCLNRGRAGKQAKCKKCCSEIRFEKLGIEPRSRKKKPDCKNPHKNKVCSGCHEEKDFSQFNKNISVVDGHSHHCKKCLKKHRDSNRQKYRENRLKNYHGTQKREKMLAKARLKSLLDPEYRKNKAEASKKRLAKNKDLIRKRSRELYAIKKNLPKIKLKQRIRSIFNRRGDRKISISAWAMKYLGCAYEEFDSHIQLQLNGDIKWYEKADYHLDHIIPISVFDLTDENDLRIALNYRNFAIITDKDNLKKSDNLLTAMDSLMSKINKFGNDEFYNEMVKFLTDKIIKYGHRKQVENQILYGPKTD